MKRALALDIGDRTVGLALSDELRITAQPLDTLRFSDADGRKKVFVALRSLMVKHEVGTVVVGLPLNMNGSEGPQAGKVRDFVTACRSHCRKGGSGEVEWVFRDERLTTRGAERALIAADVGRSRRREVIDKMAAAFILQGYLAEGYGGASEPCGD